MIERQVYNWGVDELVTRYVELSILQGRAQDLFQSISKVNRLGDEISEIDDELMRRPGDQRRLLTRLFQHPNDWVRFNAAKSTISVVPAEARRIIQAIADSGMLPQSGHAGMYLEMYDGDMSKLLRK